MGGGDDMILCKISDSANSNAYASDYNYSYTDSKYGLCFQSACGKLYRHSVITSHKLRFPIGCRLGEDTFFTLSYLVHAPNFYYVNKLLYHYFNTNEDSAVNNKSYDSIYSARDAFSDLEKYIKDNNCFERFYKTLFELKLWIKNLFINEIEKPNPKEWRNNFSELNRSLLSYSGDGRKQQVLYNLLVFHIYDFIYPMLKMYKKLKNKGR